MPQGTKPVFDATGLKPNAIVSNRPGTDDFAPSHSLVDLDGAPLLVALDATGAVGNTILAAISTNTSGLATDAHLLSGNATLTAILAKQPVLNGDGGAMAHVSNWPATQPVSLASQPLPTGAATETGNLAAIAASVALGATASAQATAGGFASTTAGSTTAISAATGTTADGTYSGSGSGSVVALLKWIGTHLGAVVLATGSAVIGGVTQSGNWVLSASSAIIGKVGLDQSTPGTTNAVVTGSIDSTGGMCFPDRYDQNITRNTDGTPATIWFTDSINIWTQTLTYASGQVTKLSRWVKT